MIRRLQTDWPSGDVGVSVNNPSATPRLERLNFSGMAPENPVSERVPRLAQWCAGKASERFQSGLRISCDCTFADNCRATINTISQLSSARSLETNSYCAAHDLIAKQSQLTPCANMTFLPRR